MIIDHPSGIQSFALLQIYYKLKLEVENPNGPRWRQPPAKVANEIMDRAGWERKHSRIKKTILSQYQAYLIASGVLKD